MPRAAIYARNPDRAVCALLGRLVVRAGLALSKRVAAETPPDLSKLPPPLAGEVDFKRDIHPIFEKSCHSCHGPEKQKNDFRLDLQEAALRGGESGKAILPGRSADSRLIHYVARLVEDKEMPPAGKGDPLTHEQIGRLRAWIDQGANWPAPDSTLDAPRAIPAHWAFKPPVRPAEPNVKNKKWPRNGIDRFVLARLEKEKLVPSPETDRATLIRRLSFDLLGLPPTPAEIVDFVNDQRPDAYEKLVERLLASPHYGERWGRHWLDAAGYADSNGYFDADTERPLAYKYRDYVIKAFNDDKPFDRFLQEQIAGDELAGYHPDADVTPEMADLLVATHFLRNAPDGTGESDGNPQEVAADRFAVLEGNVQIIGSALLGMTVQCARCHNHKFEPITQEEYYGLQAILKPAYNHEQWLKPNERVVSLGSRAEREANKRETETFERELKALKESLEGAAKPFRELVLSENLKKLPEPARDAIRKALETKPKEQTEEMKTLLKQHESLVQIKDEDLIKRFPEFAAGHSALKESLKKKETERPKPLPQIAAVTDVTTNPPPHQLLSRGVYTKPGRPVEPGVPAVFGHANKPFSTASSNTSRNSGRRLALARWLASPEHPIVARITVNRIWQHHFGAGLVVTPENLGLTGAKPTHPELLDWLATEFVRGGWSVKALQRLIVNSATYRQASAETPLKRSAVEAGRRANAASERVNAATAVDADNHLLWRFPLRRLEAEAVRDAMLAVAGELDLKLGGPFTPTKRNSDGQIVVEESHSGAKRRSLYLQQRRTQPAAMLEVFDAPQMNPNCTRRNPSTVSLQSLALLNSEFIRHRSRAFAERLNQQAGGNARQRLALAFELAYGRPPTAAERATAENFLQSQPAHYIGQPNGEKSTWIDFCQMLLASNAFLYIE